MPLTLGETFDAAAEEVQSAARTLPPVLAPEQLGALVSSLRELVDQLRAYPQQYARDPGHLPRASGAVHTVMSETSADLRAYLSTAAERVAQAAELSGGPVVPFSPSGSLEAAGQRLAISRDLLRSHRDPDGRPTTPYVVVIAQARAQRYVLRRVADVAWAAGRYADQLASRTSPSTVRAALEGTRDALDRAAVFGRQANQDAPAEMAALPFAPALTPRQYQLDTTPVLDGLAEDGDRLVRAAFQASRQERPFSGSDLQQIARSMAMGHLLAGRVLLEMGAAHTEPVAAALGDGAARLRTAAQAWQHTAQAWRWFVDTADPREHPSLPRYAYDVKRLGRAGLLPRTQPHPVTADAHAMAVRIGRFLYGSDWLPENGPRAARDVAAMLDEVGGLEPLLTGLYRLPATGRALAEAGPHHVQHVAGGLVTHDIDRRPLHVGETHGRFYPPTVQQLNALTDTYTPTARAAQKAADQLVTIAHGSGAEMLRARLDAAVQHAPTPPPPPAAAEGASVRVSAAAARSRSTTVSDQRRTAPQSENRPAHLPAGQQSPQRRRTR
ncbi:hypothetical protein CUT44_14130 [Streptomyces carminius]|uniref:Uncharacterized protein n=1 Tax=Streptomyces carminius TaxID=2665496 RepID=A0A2M8LYR6_9ACTN|nr:hypothetical protein [Streptomyces carminius]PJE97116.1 hypothetical protein CUT44_14130 [Streptomyces carminius]